MVLEGPDYYTCQFCGLDSWSWEWLKDTCPKCGKKYDAILASESEE